METVNTNLEGFSVPCTRVSVRRCPAGTLHSAPAVWLISIRSHCNDLLHQPATAHGRIPGDYDSVYGLLEITQTAKRTQSAQSELPGIQFPLATALAWAQSQHYCLDRAQ